MIYLFLPFALFISVIDLKAHRIPNYALVTLASSATIFRTLNEFKSTNSPIALLPLLLVLIFLWRWAGLGMGDVKFLIVIFAFVLSPDLETIESFTLALLVFLLLHLAIVAIGTRMLVSSLPLAPAISSAALLTLLT